MAPKFARLQHVEHTAREGVQNMHHSSRRPQTLHQNRVGQAASRRHWCSCASVASPSFSLCQSGQWSFRALLLILTLCFCNIGSIFPHSVVEPRFIYYATKLYHGKLAMTVPYLYNGMFCRRSTLLVNLDGSLGADISLSKSGPRINNHLFTSMPYWAVSKCFYCNHTL